MSIHIIIFSLYSNLSGERSIIPLSLRLVCYGVPVVTYKMSLHRFFYIYIYIYAATVVDKDSK